MSRFDEAVMLWLPDYMVEDDPEAVETVTAANGTILDFCDGHISLEQVLDELSDRQVDVDDYLDNFEQCLHRYGV